MGGENHAEPAAIQDAERGEKRLLEGAEEDEQAAKRRKIIEEARELDAESDVDESDEER